jgi:hypothetical protein
VSEIDYVKAVLEAFVVGTGRLMPSHADYAQAQAWERGQVPLSIVRRGIVRKVERCAGKPYVRTMPLSWCADDVDEEFANWKRAIGPTWRNSLEVAE